MRLLKRNYFIFFASYSLIMCFSAFGMEEEKEKETVEQKHYSPEATKDLIDAVNYGNLEAARKALAQDADPNVKFYGMTLLERAVEGGNVKLAQLLAHRGGHHLTSEEANNLIGFAAASRNTAMVEWLVGAGAHINVPASLTDYRPIDRAIHAEDMHMIEYLVSKGATIAGGRPDLIGVALSLGRAESKTVISILKLLLENGYDINHITIPGGTRPLTLTIRNHQNEITQWLLEHGATITSTVRSTLRQYGIESIFQEPLLDAIAFHNIQEALRLLKNYGRISEGSPEVEVIRRAFVLAAAQGLHELLIKMLDDYDEVLPVVLIGTALERAAMNGHSSVVEAIYDFYSEHIQHNSVVWGPYLSRALLLAAVQRRASVVQFILNQDFLYNLGLSIDQAGKRVRALLANPALQEDVRKELEELGDVLARHQQARQAGQVIAGSQLPLYFGQVGSAFGVLPPEVIQEILGYVRLPGSSK